MFPNLQLKLKENNKQRGSALVLALFIIVIMTLLGTALVRMISSNAETIVYEVVGTRAYQAAQAGVQRKLAEVFPLSAASISCPADIKWDFSAIKGLQGCNEVIVTCDDKVIDQVTYYTITSIGQCAIADVFTSRTIKVTARSL
jgi:MSHA biogenesis protein MshP